ncbi:MAG: DUF1772 domain-containing protein [bacterium]|nr:DUF1772 domain-containing protein [bacterium]
MTATDLLLLAATVGAGLTAGLCFAFATFIMRALDRLGAPSAIRAMQSINATILRSTAMLVWFGTAVVGVAAAIAVPDTAHRQTLAIVAAVLYGLGAIAVTGRGNVPLNEALARIDPESPGAADEWNNYLRRWHRWNVIRTAMMTIATAGFALAR